VITPGQCKAARALLGWTQQELAERSGVGVVTIHQLETGANQPRRATVDVVERALQAAGIEFIEENGGGPGVRLKKSPKKRT
jgi:transcriptional regulator with XRE-family HTH domain